MKKKLKKFLKIGAAIAGATIVLLLVANAVLVWIMGSRLEARITAIRDSGAPVSRQDLTRPPIPPDKNAAVFLRRAREDVHDLVMAIDRVIQTNTTPREEKPIEEGVLNDSEWKALRSVFDTYPRLIPLLQQAAACPDYDSEWDYSLDINTLVEKMLPDVQAMRAVVHVLDTQVRLLIHEGKHEEAVDTCILMFRLNRHIEKEPFLIDFLVAAACRAASIDAANRVLRSGPLPKSAYRALEDGLAAIDILATFQKSVESERASWISYFKEADFIVWPNRAYFTYDECFGLDGLTEVIAVSPLPYVKARVELKRFSPPGLFRPLTNMGHLTVAMSLDRMYRVRARLRCLRVLNALIQKKLPAAGPELNLADLGLPTEATIDPYTGEPLRLKKAADGWTVYSVGQNLTDDGGDLKDNRDVGVGPIVAAGK